MGNQWVEFVRQFAKANNIAYSRAMKVAGPAYQKWKKKGEPALLGKGKEFEDIPDEIQSQEIVPYLDNKSLLNFSQSDKRTSKNKGIRRDLRERSLKAKSDFPHLKTVALNLHSRYTPILNELQRRTQNSVFNVAFAQQYYDRVEDMIPILRRWAADPLLSKMQRRNARGIAASLADRLDDIREGLRANNQLANAPPPRRTMYQRVFES